MFSQYADIILVHGDNLLSEAIQNMTGSFFSHAALCTELGKIAEMNRYGFKYEDNHYLSGARPYVVLRHRLLMPPHPARFFYLDRIRGIVEEYRKNPPKYDYFEIINQAVKLILTREEKLTRDGEPLVPVNLLMLASERLICSGLVDTVYERAGIDLFPGRPSRHTTPGDLAALAAGGKPALLEIYRSPEIEAGVRNHS